MEAQGKLSSHEPCVGDPHVGSKVVVKEEPPELNQTSTRAIKREHCENQLEESQSLGSNSLGCSNYFSSSVGTRLDVTDEPPELYLTGHKRCEARQDESQHLVSNSVILNGNKINVKKEASELFPPSYRGSGMETSNDHLEQPHNHSRCFSSPSQIQPFSLYCPSLNNGMLADDSDLLSQSGDMLGENCETLDAHSSKIGTEFYTNAKHEGKREDMITEDEAHEAFSRLCALQNPATLSVDSDAVNISEDRTECMTTDGSTIESQDTYPPPAGSKSASVTSEIKTSNPPKSLEQMLEKMKKRKNGMNKIEDKSRRKRKPSKPSKSLYYCNEVLEKAVVNCQSSTEVTTSLATNQITGICQKLKSKPKKSMDSYNEGQEESVQNQQPSTKATTSLYVATNHISNICQEISQSEPQESMDYNSEALEGTVKNPQSSTKETASFKADLVTPTENSPSITNKEPFFTPEEKHLLLNRYECLLCGRTYRSTSALNVHIRTHYEVKPFKCTECEKGFTQKHSLIVHMRIHTGERPFVCTECGAAFADKKNLQHHKVRHSNAEMFPQKANTTCHVNTPTRIQKGEKPFWCTLCEKGFTQNHSYKAHIRIHTGERPYLCTECGSAFADNKTLQNHKALHSDEKTFKCTICPKMFRQRAGLACHMKTHTDEKPFGCDHCGQAFKTKSTLKNHQRIHSEEKPYQCPMCPQAFKQRAGLACHSKVHDKVNLYTPFPPVQGEILPMTNVHSEESPKDILAGHTLPLACHSKVHDKVNLYIPFPPVQGEILPMTNVHSEESPKDILAGQTLPLACHSKVHDKVNLYTPFPPVQGEILPMTNVHSEESPKDILAGHTLPPSNVSSSVQPENSPGFHEKPE